MNMNETKVWVVVGEYYLNSVPHMTVKVFGSYTSALKYKAELDTLIGWKRYHNIRIVDSIIEE